MKKLKNFIAALSLVFILSAVCFAGQLDMPATLPPPPPQPETSAPTTVTTGEESATVEILAAFDLAWEILSIF